MANLGIKVTQFSITATDYDEQTRKQFSLKKESFLQAEASKAQREAEVQSRLMVIEKGNRQSAEQTAASNLEKVKATITAQKEKEVAETAAAMWLRGEYDNASKEFIRIVKVYRHERMGDLNKKPIAYAMDRCDYHNGLESTKERLKSISKFIIDNRDKPMTPLESLGFSGNVNRMRDDFDLWYRDRFGSWAYHEDKKRNTIKMKWFCREMRKIQKIVDTKENFK